MEFSNITDRVNTEVVDLLVAIAILLVFLRPALEYEGAMGQFPRVFLFIGLVCLCVELLIHFLPNPYRETFQTFTSGLTEEMTDDMETKAETTQDSTDNDRLRDKDFVMIGLFLAVLAVFFAIAYLIGFLVAIPLFTLAVIYLFGSWDVLAWVVVTVLLVALVYGLFGEIMNVPIMDGALL